MEDEEYKGVPNYAPEELSTINIKGVTREEIIETIKVCLGISPLITKSNSLVSSVYSIMSELFIEDRNFVILEAPTGSGKTIIAFLLHFCVQYLHELKYNDGKNEARPQPHKQLTYFLTSSKMLQQQIDKDLDRFDFREYISMLKGTANYEFSFETDALRKRGSKDIVPYPERSCKGLSKIQRVTSMLYCACDETCPYQVARFLASESSCAVLNYAYFLNIRRGFNPFFGTRFLTIADEAHLLPEIVCNIFNFEFTQWQSNRLFKFVYETLEFNFSETKEIKRLKELLLDNFSLFSSELKMVVSMFAYFENMYEIRDILNAIVKMEGYNTYFREIQNHTESIDELMKIRESYEKLVNERPFDVYYESEKVAEDRTTGSKVFKHIVKDLSEAQLVRENFLKKINKGVFMSATLGNIDEYANMMGMKEGEYKGLKLPSTFDFDSSPIYVCKSAWLNYNNFEAQIDKAIMDTLKICVERHPKEKGIIHTSTFRICELIKEKINMGLVPDRSRFLFYQTSDEKEKLVELMKTSTRSYIIVGPSLYEGLDLKDEQGRFNILVKVPYAAMTPYIKKKMERFSFWYNRNTVEKIVQAIGRTNRHTNDYSKIYLIDSCFEKIITQTNDSILSRITYIRL